MHFSQREALRTAREMVDAQAGGLRVRFQGVLGFRV